HLLSLLIAISPAVADPVRPLVVAHSAGSVTSTGSVASASGVWPLDPQPAVVAGFDPPLSRYGAGHRGVDLAGSPGQAVRAAAAGRVTFAGSLAGRGVVVVNHGSTRTTYQPVEASVKVGTEVAAGERIGALQTFGSHCSPDACLHWGLIEGDTYLDPLTLVGDGPVRLLPLFGTAVSPSSGSPGGGSSVLEPSAAHFRLQAV
ncbi:MAG TPA: peptidoglycan DD-metalloendopeptidase family protein, partial [Pedococcus sp.]|nr:peptidoglycan DD-metalloendopeptidase family protein [Pedococcus sp.]